MQSTSYALSVQSMEGQDHMTNTKSCFIVGLPSAGKTSFLAALAYSLQQGNIPSHLHWEKFSGNQQYLAKLAETWCSGSKVQRTMPDAQQESLHLDLVGTDGSTYNVTFPDLSGETFQRQYMDREIPQSLAEAVQNSGSFLLFLNPEQIVGPVLISDLPPGTRHSKDTENVEGTAQRKRDPLHDDATAAQLVVLLQDFITLYKGQQLPLGVVVSAWDVVKDDYKFPQEFVKQQIPLLWQYLISNDDILLVRYYGVSAQGGSLYPPEKAECLLEQFEDQPLHRILVVGESGEVSHDITMPLWEMMNAQGEDVML